MFCGLRLNIRRQTDEDYQSVRDASGRRDRAVRHKAGSRIKKDVWNGALWKHRVAPQYPVDDDGGSESSSGLGLHKGRNCCSCVGNMGNMIL